jgi:hypothetical protein
MNTVIALTAELNLAKTVNQGLEAALLNKQKRRKRSRNVFEEIRAKDSNSATFFSP